MSQRYTRMAASMTALRAKDMRAGALALLFFTVAVLFLVSPRTVTAQTTDTFTTNGTFTVPVGVTEITVELWGGGGAGASRNQSGTRGGGGGGGSFRSAVVNVLPGDEVTVVVGSAGSAAGAAQAEVNGGDSSVSSSAEGRVFAVTVGGGVTPTINSPVGGAAGDAGSATGVVSTVSVSGTDGGDGDGTNSGAGGTGGNGGGVGGASVSGNSAGLDGTPPGGGGSGASSTGANFQAGGSGARGEVRITYTIDLAVADFEVVDPGSTIAGVPSAPFTINLLASSGDPAQAGAGGITFALSSSSVTGTFTPAESVTIPEGQESVTFQYTNTRLGTDTITVTRTSGGPEMGPKTATIDVLGRIEGVVSDLISGTPLSGVLVELSGDQTGSVTTGIDGAFSFVVAKDLEVTLTPTLANYTFDPDFITYPADSRDVNLEGEVFFGQLLPGANLTPTADESTLTVTPLTITGDFTSVATVQLRNSDDVALPTSGIQVFMELSGAGGGAFSNSETFIEGTTDSDGRFSAVYVPASFFTPEAARMQTVTAYLGTSATDPEIGQATITIQPKLSTPRSASFVRTNESSGTVTIPLTGGTATVSDFTGWGEPGTYFVSDKTDRSSQGRWNLSGLWTAFGTADGQVPSAENRLTYFYYRVDHKSPNIASDINFNLQLRLREETPANEADHMLRLLILGEGETPQVRVALFEYVTPVGFGVTTGSIVRVYDDFLGLRPTDEAVGVRLGQDSVTGGYGIEVRVPFSWLSLPTGSSISDDGTGLSGLAGALFTSTGSFGSVGIMKDILEDGNGNTVILTGSLLTGGTIFAQPNGPNSSISISPAQIQADNTATATITLVVRDENNDPIRSLGAADFVFSGVSNATIGDFVDLDTGTYTFTIRSGTPQTLNVGVSVSGIELKDESDVAKTAPVTFVGPATQLLVTNPDGGPIANPQLRNLPFDVRVTLADVNGVPVPNTGGPTTITLTGVMDDPAQENAVPGILKFAFDDADPPAAVTVDLPADATSALVTGVLYNGLSGEDGLDVNMVATAAATPGEAGGKTGESKKFSVRAIVLAIAADPGTGVVANGEAASLITVTLTDAGEPKVPQAGQTIRLTTNLGWFLNGEDQVQEILLVTGIDGQVTATLRSAVVGTATVSASCPGECTVSEDVEFVAGAATGAQSTIAADPATGVVADNMATSTLTITARDANNNLVANQAVFFAITDGTGGTLSSGPWTTDGSGVATATLTSTNAATLTVTGYLGGNSSGTSVGTATIGFVAGAAASLAITTPAAGAASGAAFTTQPVVQIWDAQNNLVNTSTANVTMTVSDGGTVVGTATATAVAGVAMFSDVGISGTAGTTYTLTFASTGLTSATQTITPTAGAASQLAIMTQPSDTAASGAAFEQQPVIQLRDASGNNVSQSGVVVTAAIASGGGDLGGTLTATTDASGVASFSGLAITGTAGVRTLTFTATGLTAVTSGEINITAGAAVSLAINAGNNQSATVGTAVTTAPSVIVRDASNNPVAGVEVTFAVATGGGTVDPATAVTTGADGIAAVTSWTLGATAGSNTLTATSGSLTGSPLTFTAMGTAGDANKLTFGVQPSNTVSGASITDAVTVRIEDANGNLVSSTANVTLAITADTGTADAVLSGTVTVTAVGGVATFSDLSIDKAGTDYTLSASSEELSGATSATFTITAAAPGNLTYGTDPAPTSFGTGGTSAAPTLDLGGSMATFSITAPDPVPAGITIDPLTGVISWTGELPAGTYDLTITATTAGGTTTAPFTITVAPKDGAELTVDAIASQTFTGSALTPPVVISDGETTLVEGTDYTLSYADNVQVGTATVTITFQGNYSGMASASFEIAARHFTLTVTDGSGSGVYVEGAQVAITAAPPATGKVFDAWVGDVDALAAGGASLPNTTVTIPARNVSLTATYKDAPPTRFALTVLGGGGSGEYVAGTQVTIVANPAPSGSVFDRWTGDIGFVNAPNLPTTEVVMPEAAITVQATYKDASIERFALSVTSGSGSGEYRSGREVSIAANPAPEGQVFDRWVGDIAHVETPLNPNTTVVMPASEVAITASYKARPVETFALTVGSGSGSGDYATGQSVTIAANPAAEGQVFDRWRGQTGFLTNPNAPNTEVVMPSDTVSVQASYRDRPVETFALSVTSGTGSGDYAAGEVISVAAEPAEDGQVFVRWSGQTAQVANVNLPNTTLTMPASDVSITAIYEDSPGPQEQTLTVIDGTGDGEYLPGRVVLIQADVREGEIFDRWVGQTAGVSNANIPNTTIVMPNAAIQVTATFKPDPQTRFMLRQRVRLSTEASEQQAGNGDSRPSSQATTRPRAVQKATTRPRAVQDESTTLLNERDVLAGAIVRLIAPQAPDGFVFDKWVGQTTHVDNINQASTFIYMPAAGVDITATYRPQLAARPLTVESGAGDGDYLAGTEITITANVPEPGFVFERWEGQTAQVANVNRPSTTLRMPQTAVRVRAVYRELPPQEFKLTVRGNASEQLVEAGKTVTIRSRNPEPDEAFARWAGQVGTVDDIFAPETTVYMPATDVTVLATFDAVYIVTASVDDEGGTVSPTSQEVVDGDRAEITLMPNDGWLIDTVTGCGSGGSLSGNVWTTGQIAGNCALSVRFVWNRYAVTLAADPAEGGTVSGAGEYDVGNEVTVTATPATGFAFINWTAGESEVASETSYTFSMPAKDRSLVANFALHVYTVSASASEGGSISPASRNVAHGQTTTFTVTPETGFLIDEISGCAGSLVDNTYTTGPVTADCAVTASFRLQLFDIQIEGSLAGVGQISCEPNPVLFGGSTVCTATPAEGFVFAEWMVCAGEVDGNSCRLSNVRGPISIAARFAQEHELDPPIPVPVNHPLFLLLLALLTFGLAGPRLWRRSHPSQTA